MDSILQNNIEELGKTYNTAFKEIKFSEKDILRLASVSVLKGNEAALEKAMPIISLRNFIFEFLFISSTSKPSTSVPFRF
jgi:hypothetical protein